MSGRDKQETRNGFTLVELLVTMVLSAIVLTAVYDMLSYQSKLYRVQRETMDVRESLRSAASLLAWELMGISSSDGDLYTIAPDSISVRSLAGAGVICSRVQVGPKRRFGIQLVTGLFDAAVGDSALAYAAAQSVWSSFKIADAFNVNTWEPAPVGGGTPVCFWGDSTTSVPRPQAALELSGDSASLANLAVGSPLRAFRQVSYALTNQDGRWWLGRRLGGSNSYEIMTGPMLAPAEGGLAFTYYDADGVVTADPRQVAEIEIALRAESFGPSPSASNVVLSDSLRLTVFLRGN